MSQILYPPARAQTLGEVLKTGGQIYRLSLRTTLPYGAIVAICGDLANLRNLSVGLPVQSFDSTDPIWWAWNVAGSILALLFGSAMFLRQKALAAGEPASVAAEMKLAGVLLSRVIACVALSTVAVSLALVPVALALPGTGLDPTLRNLDSVNVGMLLLLIPLSLPAAWLSLGLLFAPPALLLQKLGPVAAMRASFRLLRGNWWRASVLTTLILGVLVMMVLLVATMASAAVLLTGASDLTALTRLVLPLGIVCGAMLMPWCSAQLLAMMGDLLVRQQQARAGSGGTSAGPGLK
jgi:hypothetical protein